VTDTLTNTYTITDTPTITDTFTSTFTWTHTPTVTDTLTNTYTITDTPTDTPTITDTFTSTFTWTHTPTVTDTPTSSFTITDTPTNTPTITDTFTSTFTKTYTPTVTDTFTNTYTITDIPTDTPMDTATATPTETATDTVTDTPSITPTGTSTNTFVNTPTMTATALATINLRTAVDYAVLAGTTITNSGATTLCGNLGLSPGTSVTGAPVLSCGGVTHVTDDVAMQAQLDLTAAYTDAAGRTGGATLVTASDMKGLTLYPGLYTEFSSLGLTGSVTLDAQGDPNAVFIIQIGSTLTTVSGSSVILTGNAKAANVFWQVGDTCTLGTTTIFEGTIMALNAIIFNTGAVLEGRALARNAEVTFLTNNITKPAP
jgi:hypothetical protein